MMKGQIRRAVPGDAGRLAEIYNEYVLRTTISFETEAVTEAEMRSRIEAISSAFPYFVYEYDGTVIGYCYAHPWKDRAAYAKTLETTVYLAPEACGQGIGEALMRRLIEECCVGGFHSLIACVTAENSTSVRFHERLGFHPVSRFAEVGLKFGRWLDVVDLQLIL